MTINMSFTKRITVLIATLFLLITGCSDKEVGAEFTEKGTLSFTVTLPETTPNSIDSRWKRGDRVEICVVYDGKKERKVVSVKNISSDAKTAEFDLEMPNGDYAEFDLFGVYGRGKLSPTDYTKVTLPGIEAAGSLDGMQDITTLTFAARGILFTNPPETLHLEHLGALFNFAIKNESGSALDGVKKIQLAAASSLGAHVGTGVVEYDFIDDQFSGTSTESTSIAYTLSTPATIDSDKFLTMWGWFIPSGKVKWPEIKFELFDTEDILLATTPDSKYLDINPLTNGNVYSVFANWNGDNLHFVDEVLENAITITTSREAGSVISIRLDAASSDQGEVWIDLNNNGTREPGEEIAIFNAFASYTLSARVFSIYGNVHALTINGQGITGIDLSNCYRGMDALALPSNEIAEIDVSSLPHLHSLTINNNNLSSLNLVSNSALKYLYAENNQLSSVVLPDSNIEMDYIKLFMNNLSESAINEIIHSLHDRTGKDAGFLDIIERGNEEEKNNATKEHYYMGVPKNWDVRDSDTYPLYTPIPLAGMVAHYPFDGNGNDASSNRNHAMYVSATSTPNRHNEAGKALKFDGVANYVEIQNRNYLSIAETNELSISVWMRPDVLNFPKAETSDPYVHWLGKGIPGHHEYVLRIYNKESTRPNRMSCYSFNLAGGLGAGTYVEEPIEAGKWIHLVAMYDFPNNAIILYKNGKYNSQSTFTSYDIIPQRGNAPLRVGTRDFKSYLEGAVDDLRIYNRVLSAEEVHALFIE